MQTKKSNHIKKSSDISPERLAELRRTTLIVSTEHRDNTTATCLQQN